MANKNQMRKRRELAKEIGRIRQARKAKEREAWMEKNTLLAAKCL